jgi:hypothetical protein
MQKIIKMSRVTAIIQKYKAGTAAMIAMNPNMVYAPFPESSPLKLLTSVIQELQDAITLENLSEEEIREAKNLLEAYVQIQKSFINTTL